MTVTEASNRSLEEQFDLFCSASSFRSIVHSFNQLCAMALPKPGQHPWTIYTQLTGRLKCYWKAAALFERLDKRVQRPEYMHQTACSGMNVLVVGCGPCGLRCAIELALLGARVVIVEKRDTFSRNNVLHLWPYLIEDLRALGAKTFFGKFCAGSIDHVSIRTLQCILLKAALLFGVQVFVGVTYRGLVEPNTGPLPTKFPLANRVFLEHENTVSLPNGEHQSCKPSSCSTSTSTTTSSSILTRQAGIVDKTSAKRNGVDKPVGGGAVVSLVQSKQQQQPRGWRVQLEPELAVLSHQYDIDVLIGADGKRSCLGFPSKELRCRLALAITVNFINYHTPEETQVEEISGVSSIFNQQFFARLASDTGIDLENIVYYKDETHYFVMTAKKHSLLAKGVLRQDREDSASLLSVDNVDRRALEAYARETARYVTHGKLSQLDFALNARGEPDVELFDFTRMFAAEYSCRILERNQYLLMQCLIGDGLFEPFWPTGSGCALGFLSALDAAWAVSRLASGLHPIQVLVQRESVYQRLSQTTAQNMPTNFADYALDPRTRYVRCNLNLFSPVQVRHLYCSDKLKGAKAHHWHHENGSIKTGSNQFRDQLIMARSHGNGDRDPTAPYCPLALLRWYQFRLALYESFDLIDPVLDLTPARWDSGANLLCLIHLYRPDLVPELEQFFVEQQQYTASRDTDESNEHSDRKPQLQRDQPDPRGVLSVPNGVPHPKPSLIRACGLLIEHFNVEFVPDLDSGASTYPRSMADWHTYLVQVQHALSELRIAGPPRLAASLEREKPATRIHSMRSPSHWSNHNNSNNKKSPMKAVVANGQGPALGSPLLMLPRQFPGDPIRTNGRVRGVFREDPNWSVEKGLLLKRRAELIATLQDPASTKRRSADAQAQLNDARLKHSQRLILSQMALNTVHDRDRLVSADTPSQSGDQSKPAVIKPVAVPENVARLFAPRKGSAHCYACNKRLYLIERLMAFDLFFHRHCFRCSECGVQLQVDKATCVRGNGHSEPDKFYCPSHAQTAPGSAVQSRQSKPRVSNASSGASLEARLRAGQFPFGPPDRVSSVSGSQENAPLSRTQSFTDLIPYNRAHTSAAPQTRPLQSALLAGLPGDGDDAEEIMGVVSVPQLVRQFRKSAQMAAESSSSTTSPERRPSGLPRRTVGPAGDAERPRGIRDDSAPGPDCYLAGHLGLPEVERRANWELNQSSAWPDASIPDILEHMRMIRPNLIALDDYFASSESEQVSALGTDSESRSAASSIVTESASVPAGPSPAAATTGPILRRPRRPPIRGVVRPSESKRREPLVRARVPCSSAVEPPQATPDDSDISDSTLARFVTPNSHGASELAGRVCSPSGSATSSLLSSPAHRHLPRPALAAKEKFCLEPPKPFTIDPKQFVSSRNRDRCVTGELSDCSEVLGTIDIPDVQRASVNAVGSVGSCHAYSNRVAVLDAAAQGVPTNRCELRPVGHPAPTRANAFPVSAEDGPYECLQTKVSECSTTTATAPFAALDEFRDLDSVSTVTEKSSTTEHTPELDRNPAVQLTRSGSIKFAQTIAPTGPSIDSGDYDNLLSARPPTHGAPLVSYRIGVRPKRPVPFTNHLELRRRVRSDERLPGATRQNGGVMWRAARSELDETDTSSETTSSADLDSVMSIRPLPGAFARLIPNSTAAAKPDPGRVQQQQHSQHDAFRSRCVERNRETMELTRELESLESTMRHLEMAGVETERELYSMNPRASAGPHSNRASGGARSRTLNYHVTYDPSRTVAVSAHSHGHTNNSQRGASERRYVLLKRLAAMLATKSALLEYASNLTQRRDQLQLDRLQDVPSGLGQSTQTSQLLTRSLSEPNLTDVMSLEPQQTVRSSSRPSDDPIVQSQLQPDSTCPDPSTTHGDVTPRPDSTA